MLEKKELNRERESEICVTKEKEADEREETEWVLRRQSGGSNLLLHFIVLFLFVPFLFVLVFGLFWVFLIVVCEFVYD
jgi:hypothetical protein